MTDAEQSGRRAAVSPVITLLTISAIWDARLDGELRGLGLTTRKYGLLAHIHATPGISFSELARRSQITVQSAHAAVRSLVEAGFVADATAHAGSASVLRVTDAGAGALATAETSLARLDVELGRELPMLSAALARPHDDSVPGDLQAN
jgi:DNA-binding MarR family transcriptional regulator